LAPKCTPGKVFNTSHHAFGKVHGTEESISMCQQSTSNDMLCGLPHKADQNWKHHKSDNKLYSWTYIDTTPNTWSAMYIAACYTWVFVQNTLRSAHKSNQFWSESIAAHPKTKILPKMTPFQEYTKYYWMLMM
jgi:hypothetical protein